MPYGYYQLIRFVSTMVFIYFAVTLNHKHEKGFDIIYLYITLAILFQPFFKIALGRGIWNFLDVAVGIFLIISAFYIPSKIPNKKKLL